MSAEDISVARLIATVNPAQPIDVFQTDLFLWASALGQGPVATLSDFHRVRRALAVRAGVPVIDRLMADFYLATGTLAALERRPPRGFEDYVKLWDQQCSSNQIHRLGKSDFGRLQQLEVRLGGVLLEDRSQPYLLILPQPDGTYVVIGWQYVALVDASPFLDPGVIHSPVKLHAPSNIAHADRYRDPAPASDPPNPTP